MNNKIHIDAEIIKLLYLKYREYMFPLLAFCISWFVFIQFVIPQIQNFLTVKDAVASSEQTLAVVTQNYNILVNLQDGDIQQQFNIANQALPQVKDFAGILRAISAAAGLSGVSVNDYSFQIGDINSITQSTTGNQTIQLSLTIKGDINQTKQFLTALSQQLPLSEVSSVNLVNSESTAITANFFYSQPVKVSFVATTPFPTIYTSQKKLLQDLAKNAVENTTSIPVILPTPQLTTVPSSSTSSH